MSKISVIVPVFNVELYLKRCVDSILMQSFSDFDLILVDDGSRDSCGIICDAYGKKDNRVHVIHQQNKGLSEARNAGIDYSLKCSDSSWLTFIDSDDWINPDYLIALLNAVTECGADIAVVRCMVTAGEPLPDARDLQYELKETEAFYNAEGIIGTVAWGKLYKKELFRELRYPAGKIHEDEFVTYKLLFQFPTIPVINSQLYAYFQNKDGIIQRPWSIKRLSAVEALAQQVVFFTEHQFLSAARSRFRCLVFLILDCEDRILQCESLSSEEKKRYVRSAKKQLKGLLIKYKRYGWVRLRNRGRDLLAYENAFKSIHIGLVLWRKLKTFPSCFRKSEKVSHKEDHKSQELQKEADYKAYVRQQKHVQAVLFQSPLHENLGDHAISIAEMSMLESMGVSCLDFPLSAQIEEKCANKTAKNKVILIQGGGFLGSLWTKEEEAFREEVRAFKNNPIIVFPQTVFFDMSTDDERAYFEKSKSIYESHPNLLMFVREKYSYEFLRNNMPKLRISLVPDMAMLLKPKIEKSKRIGVLICLREDKEKNLSLEAKEQILRIINDRGLEHRYTSTVLSEGIDLNQRHGFVQEKLREFASAKVVVTDRLHGMIFAAVTETPCIVLNSRSYKVKGCYEWLRNLDYIQFAETVEDIPGILDKLDKVTPQYDRAYIEHEMQPLFDAIMERIT